MRYDGINLGHWAAALGPDIKKVCHLLFLLFSIPISPRAKIGLSGAKAASMSTVRYLDTTCKRILSNLSFHHVY
jgi:hypothetical protein